MTFQAASADSSGLNTLGFLTILTALLSSLTLALSATIANVAVPDIMGAFGIGQDQAQWLATAFFAAMTSGMLVSSWAIESFGERHVFVAMMGCFFVGSVIGGTAAEFEMIILARATQGFTAGVMLPLTQLAMYRVLGPHRRSTANGLFGLSFVLGPGMGPYLGGITIDAFDWRSTFYVALPVACATALLASYVLPNRQHSGPRPAFDWVGFALLCTFLLSTLTGLSNGQRLGWSSDAVVGLLTLGLFCAVGFVCWEWVYDKPILEVRLFRSRQIAAANLVSFLFGAGLFGSLYLTPVFVQIVQNYTPTRAGEVLIPAGLVLGLVLPLMGRIGDRVPPIYPLAIGLAGFAYSNYLLGRADANTAFWSYALIVLFGRAFLSAIFPPLMGAGLRGLPVERIPDANGAINFTRQMGGAFGINLLAIFLEQRTAFFSEMLAGSQSAANSATSELLTIVEGILSTGGLDEAMQQSAATYYLGEVVAAQATALAFRDTFLLFAIFSLVCMACTLLLVPGRERNRTP